MTAPEVEYWFRASGLIPLTEPGAAVWTAAERRPHRRRSPLCRSLPRPSED